MALIVVLFAVLLIVAAWMDVKARRRGGRVRSSGQMRRDIIEQRRWAGMRQSTWVRESDDIRGATAPRRRTRRRD